MLLLIAIITEYNMRVQMFDHRKGLVCISEIGEIKVPLRLDAACNARPRSS